MTSACRSSDWPMTQMCVPPVISTGAGIAHAVRDTGPGIVQLAARYADRIRHARAGPGVEIRLAIDGFP